MTASGRPRASTGSGAPLPVSDALPGLAEALRACGRAVLVAPPGSGKTTVVPPWLVASGLAGDGEVVVLQPRRVAARSVATFLAEQRGERPGDFIGYQVRLEKRVSAKTRVRIVTEGILTAWLQRDPSLEGVGCVVLDEFHERSVHADLGLALLREVMEAWRPDLRVLVMSATLEAEPVAAWLGAPVVRATGRAFPLSVGYREVGGGGALKPGGLARVLDVAVAATVELVAGEGADTAGDVLVFMPGAREIDEAVRRLGASLTDCQVLALHGRLPPAEQDRAVRPDLSGLRRVIVATNVAETSLTIPGVRAVVDSGLVRVSRFDPAVGSTRLELERVSFASADQRAGRAGRLGPGRVLRLWSPFEQERLATSADPEIHRVDPAQIYLQLKLWGVSDPSAFPFFEAPSARNLADAEARLRSIGALDGQGLTPAGRLMATLPLEPGPAAALLRGRQLPTLPAVARVLAALSEGQAMGEVTTQRQLPPRVDEVSRQLAGLARGEASNLSGFTAPDLAQAFIAAFPGQLAVRRGPDHWQLSGGRRAAGAAEAREACVALDLDGGRRGENALSRVRAWLELSLADLMASPSFRTTSEVVWDPREARAVAFRRDRVGDLVLSERPEPLSDRVAAATLLAAELDREPARLVTALENHHASRFERLLLFARLFPEAGLPASVASWARALLPALCEGHAAVSAMLQTLQARLGPAIDAAIPHDTARRIVRALPSSVTVPSGREVPLQWVADGDPILAVKVQELFGWERGPVIAEGRVACVIHLLDPGGKPLQVTRDLASFWRETWRAVRSEMRSRYPKHHWPEDPVGEVASTRTTARAYRAMKGDA